MDIDFINEILEKGLVFDNRRKLSEAIGEPYEPRTNSQKSQNKEWRKYFDFQKVGRTQSIVITEVYKKKRENVTVRGGSFPKKLDPEVFSALKVGEYYTLNSIANEISILPSDIIFFHDKHSCWKKIVAQIDGVKSEDLSSEENIDSIRKKQKYRQLNAFVSISTHTCRNRIRTSLNRLKRNGLIDFEYGYVIKFEPYYRDKIMGAIANGDYQGLKEFTFPELYNEIMRIINLENSDEIENELYSLNSSLEFDDETRMATEEETNFIRSFYDKKLKELVLKSERELYRQYEEKQNVISDFYDAVNMELDKYNISVFKGYYITYIADVEFDKTTDDLQSDFVKELLQSRKKSLYAKFKKRYKEAKIVTPETERLLKQGEEKAENYYNTFESHVDKFLK
ncbi:MAG: hypothetical protein E7418_01835 [Ruminococcaceae bacterium]|nr:hypothetical protein [Oscillospiraceae bacterium]